MPKEKMAENIWLTRELWLKLREKREFMTFGRKGWQFRRTTRML